MKDWAISLCAFQRKL